MNTFLTPFIKTTSNTKYFYIELVGSNNIIYEKTNFLNYEDNTNCIYLTNNYMVLETNELKEEHIFSFSTENIFTPRLKCIICLLDKNFNCVKSVFLDYLFSLKTHNFKYKIIDDQLTPNHTTLFKSFYYKDFNEKTTDAVNIMNEKTTDTVNIMNEKTTDTVNIMNEKTTDTVNIMNEKTTDTVNIMNKNNINTQKPTNNNIVPNNTNVNKVQRRPFGMRFT